VSLLLFVRYGFAAEAFIASFVATVLVVASAEDLRRRVIPNRLILPAWIITLSAQLLASPDRWREWVAASLGAALLLLVPALLYPAGLGMGDVKLVLLIGAAVGEQIIPALLIGTLGGACFGIALMAWKGSRARRMIFPLGPFLAAGAITVLIFA
jgi:leader peptidase (prepilin peptidase)/N-methyltransferase